MAKRGRPSTKKEVKKAEEVEEPKPIEETPKRDIAAALEEIKEQSSFGIAKIKEVITSFIAPESLNLANAAEKLKDAGLKLKAIKNTCDEFLNVEQPKSAKEDIEKSLKELDD